MDASLDRFTAPADARVFLGRLTRIDPGALVRLQPAGEAADRTALWARLPWAALVTRDIPGAAPGDVTVAAQALLDGAAAPTRRDTEWRWPLPPAPGPVLEEIPADALQQVAAAAAGTLHTVSHEGLHGRAVGSRVVRDALLDHVPITVQSPDAAPVHVPQRLVQAVVRMGFLGAETVGVRRAGDWVGLVARYGTAWLPPAGGPLTLRPT